MVADMKALWCLFMLAAVGAAFLTLVWVPPGVHQCERAQKLEQQLVGAYVSCQGDPSCRMTPEDYRRLLEASERVDQACRVDP